MSLNSAPFGKNELSEQCHAVFGHCDSCRSSQTARIVHVFIQFNAALTCVILHRDIPVYHKGKKTYPEIYVRALQINT